MDKFFISENNIYREILPDNFELSFSTISQQNLSLQPSYDLGLLFGLYAGYGHISEDIIKFVFGPNDILIKKLKELLYNIFKVHSTFEKDNYCYYLNIDCNLPENKHLLDIFQEFSDKLHRCIPKKYWISNESFIRGLFDGLIEYDEQTNSSRFITVSKYLCEVLVWISSILGYSLMNKDLSICDSQMEAYFLQIDHTNDDLTLGKVIEINDIDTNMDTFTLIVDCTTNTFIANGLITKSS